MNIEWGVNGLLDWGSFLSSKNTKTKEKKKRKRITRVDGHNSSKTLFRTFDIFFFLADIFV